MNLLQYKKQRVIIILLFCIIFLVGLGSVVYSAINSTMSVTGDAYARVEADVRITDFRLASSSNATSSYEEFGKEHVVTEVDLLNSSSYVTYYLEITNYGSTDVGIYDITGLPSGVSYSIKDYNLGDKICDDSGKCNSFVTKTFEITLTTSSTYFGNVQLNFDFRVFHNITYIGFENEYLDSVMDGDSVFVDLSSEGLKYIEIDSNDVIDYTYTNYVLNLNNVTNSVKVINKSLYKYEYTGDVQTFVAPVDGIYKIELWGAQGGPHTGSLNAGGQGAYVSGEIFLANASTLYIYVGDYGYMPDNLNKPFNGGGAPDITGNYSDSHSGKYSGGGATDIRLYKESWDSFDSLKSRIMVAAGGAGGNNGDGTVGGAGGGILGKAPVSVDAPTQTFGYSFGIGQGSGFYPDDLGADTGAGGGGYYGGFRGFSSNSGGSGGSSFISGHNGCDAIDESSTSSSIVHTGQNIHYSGYTFFNTVMIDGEGYNWTTEIGQLVGMPNYKGNGSMVGNEENGYSKISLLEMGKFHSITYNNIAGNYENFVLDGEDISITFDSVLSGIEIKNSSGTAFNNYTYDATTGVLNIYDVTSDLVINSIN